MMKVFCLVFVLLCYLVDVGFLCMVCLLCISSCTVACYCVCCVIVILCYVVLLGVIVQCLFAVNYYLFVLLLCSYVFSLLC